MRYFILWSGIFFLAACASTTKTVSYPHSDTLWHIIDDQCVPSYQKGEGGKPCVEVHLDPDREHGYVLLKDRVGDLQYLLMPTAKIAGMESPQLVAPDAAPYFAIAWSERAWMEKKFGGPIPLEAMSLAVNSAYGRSQNQLHIHVSCVRPEVQKQLQTKWPHIQERWRPLPEKILKHSYYARRISENDLLHKNVFALLRDEIPAAKANPGEFGLGLVVVKDREQKPRFVLVSSRKESLTQRGSVEEIQNHDCPQLAKTP